MPSVYQIPDDVEIALPVFTRPDIPHMIFDHDQAGSSEFATNAYYDQLVSVGTGVYDTIVRIWSVRHLHKSRGPLLTSIRNTMMSRAQMASFSRSLRLPSRLQVPEAIAYLKQDEQIQSEIFLAFMGAWYREQEFEWEEFLKAVGTFVVPAIRHIQEQFPDLEGSTTYVGDLPETEFDTRRPLEARTEEIVEAETQPLDFGASVITLGGLEQRRSSQSPEETREISLLGPGNRRGEYENTGGGGNTRYLRLGSRGGMPASPRYEKSERQGYPFKETSRVGMPSEWPIDVARLIQWNDVMVKNDHGQVVHPTVRQKQKIRKAVEAGDMLVLKEIVGQRTLEELFSQVPTEKTQKPDFQWARPQPFVLASSIPSHDIQTDEFDVGGPTEAVGRESSASSSNSDGGGIHIYRDGVECEIISDEDGGTWFKPKDGGGPLIRFWRSSRAH
ncbi:hypothetical protein Dda_6337 [Drechslerella dactyloides]|uniref:RNase III domain-containing protein n=1 Tax=Drechslerella dactyloides TaxID=74499 RepID=A0AAD6ITN8_DREDA|nr:hypothetical protein Dda_6337 [Drechslerella dactyloides]